MHVTLHLTNNCNLRCRYCYVDHAGDRTMTPATIRKSIDFAHKLNPNSAAGIAFFGGEPLLCKDLIYDAVDYCNYLKAHGGARFHLKMTTNGTLLDDAFFDFADREGIFIAVSVDGTQAAHDGNRVDCGGIGTYAAVTNAARKLLLRQVCSPAMMVVTPDTVGSYAAGVDALFRLGFRYLICSLDYAGDWDAVSLRELKRQYRLLSDWYYAHTLKEDKFYLSPFEVKLASHIKGDAWCQDRCELGRKQVSIAPDGTLYPCVQFVGEERYAMGHVDTGIDESRRMSLFELGGVEQKECLSCAIRNRCLHTCGCLNKQVTGCVDRVAPSLCAHERILLPIADKLGERLYRRRDAMFIQKHYNEMYPLVSMVEDAAEKETKAGAQ